VFLWGNLTLSQTDNKYPKDKKLKGAIIYLVSGHGGHDPGAIATVDGHKISEDEYAYDICMRIERFVSSHDGTAYMIIKDLNDGIRDDKYLKIDYDEVCYPNQIIPLNQTERIRQRAKAINDIYNKNKFVKYQVVLEIHCDSRSEKEKVDVFFYYYKKSPKGQKLAENILSVFTEKYAKRNPPREYKGTVKGKNLQFLRETNPPAILIELGNIQNEKDRKRLLDYNQREALAKWITEGIIKDFQSINAK
jgi:N-acetylmuramoyl-L-alanine amidase